MHFFFAALTILRETLVSEYDLVCENTWKKGFIGQFFTIETTPFYSGMSYMIGLFIGSYILGYISDRLKSVWIYPKLQSKIRSKDCHDDEPSGVVLEWSRGRADILLPCLCSVSLSQWSYFVFPSQVLCASSDSWLWHLCGSFPDYCGDHGHRGQDDGVHDDQLSLRHR